MQKYRGRGRETGRDTDATGWDAAEPADEQGTRVFDPQPTVG